MRYAFLGLGQMGRVLASHVNAESVLFRGLNVDLPAARFPGTANPAVRRHRRKEKRRNRVHHRRCAAPVSPHPLAR